MSSLLPSYVPLSTDTISVVHIQIESLKFKHSFIVCYYLSISAIVACQFS